MLQAYQVGYSSPEANVGVVQKLLDTRQQIAELLGAPSYSHYQAGRDTLAQNPSAVTAFLKGEPRALAALHPVKSPCRMQSWMQWHVACSSARAAREKVVLARCPRCHVLGFYTRARQLQPGLGESVADKAREEVERLHRHSKGASTVRAWDELYLRAKVQAAEVQFDAVVTRMCCV
jgi:Zn-dependent oligopeptidase